MRILETAIYRGPHLYSATPMIRLQVDLEALEDHPSNTLPGFNQALLRLLPSLEGHGCSLKRRGGLVRRLEDGTWLGHVAEHVALELQSLAGARVTRGKTRSVRGRPGVYNVMYAYRDEAVGLLAGAYALQLVESLLPVQLRGVSGWNEIRADGFDPSAPFDLSAALRHLKRIVDRVSLGPTTRALVDEALARSIPVTRLDDQSLIRLGYGRRQKMIRASITGETSFIAVETAGDKSLAKSLMEKAAVPVPRGAVVRSADEAVREAARIRGPVVIKPLDGNHGRGVTVGVKNEGEVRHAFELAARHSRRVIVEEQYHGRDYRILVIGGQVVAVAERVPAQVVGDGRSTVAQLIDQVNADPRRGRGHENVMTRIVVDEHVTDMLGRAALTLDSVPSAGRVVQLRATANLSTGGEAIDRTDEIHPDNTCIARRAALVIGLDIAGIDFLAPDITRSVRETGGGVVEINAAPGFRMHLKPSRGRSRDVARPVLAMLYPDAEQSRIPVIAITGTNGKSTTSRMVSHMFRLRGHTVGMTTTSGIYINDELLWAGDASGPKSARMVLADPLVDLAVLETARGGILREGLAFDTCDVGVVLNVAEDHLGLKGVDTVEDLAAVKSIVVESVARRGTSVLNADDPLTLRMAKHAGGRLIWFTLNGGPDLAPHLQKHLALGGRVVALEPSIHGGEIVILDGDRRMPVMSAAKIPATLDGLASFNVANALAATAVGYAQGLEPAAIAEGLSTFSNSFEHSPGRLNVFDGHGFRVIVDYAHNPAGLAALVDLVGKLRPRYERVIGMVSIPGDRRDEDIRQMGEIGARAFDRLVFRERPDSRGRRAGEVIELLCKGAHDAGFPPERIDTYPEEREAIQACLAMARPGDLVVLTPTMVEESWRQVVEFRPAREPLREIDGFVAEAVGYG